MSQNLCWPFEAICDRDGNPGDWHVLHGPLVTPDQLAQFAELRRQRARFVGMTSYLDFPRQPVRAALDHESACEAWCHCFRQPERYFAGTGPRALLSASDFTDWLWVSHCAAQGAFGSGCDIVYVGAQDPWQRECKNWRLAARCLPRLYKELGLRTLVIGQADAELCEQPGLHFEKALPWPSLLAAMAQARLLFVPNLGDPSPRVITEALCLDLPLLMNRQILGGWKYLNRFTGAFFEDELDVVQACATVLAASLKPRDWFRSNFGPELASRRLASLLRIVDPTLEASAGWRITAAGPRACPAASG